MRFPVLHSVFAVALLLPVGVAAGGLANAATAQRDAPASSVSTTKGGDISWPNCPKGLGIPSRRSSNEPMPDQTAKFVVVGLTNGPGFFPNPCIADQLTWVAAHHRLLAAYAMTTFPRASQILHNGQNGPYDGTTARGALRNAGYAEATYNLATMSALEMLAPIIWVDVEPYPTAPWTKNHRDNRDVIRGAIRAYTDAGHQVGIYTYANGWRQVVGGWKRPNLPVWGTIGHGTAKEALASCGTGPSGGPNWLMQWWRNDSRDRDLVCPGAPDQGVLFTAPPD